MLDKGYVSFSFDDGRGDNYEVYKSILKPKNIPATFNIAAGYIDGTCPKESTPSLFIPPMTIEQVKEIYADGLVEIALHGNKHINTEEDIRSGEQKIRKWTGAKKDERFGFASPGSRLNIKHYLASDNKYLKENLLYVRTHQRFLRNGKLKVLVRKICRILHWPSLFSYVYKDTLMDSCEDKVIYSVPVLKDTTLKEILGLLSCACRNRKAVVLMFHSVVDNIDGHDNFSWSVRDFRELCHIIQSWGNEYLGVVTTKDLLLILAKR